MSFKWEKILYIAVNLLVSSLNFIRSFVLLNYLSFFELGQITILQTIIQLINIFQLGFLNGGYRIYALEKEGVDKRVNDTIFSFILILFVLAAFSATFFYQNSHNNNFYIISLGLIIGITSIISNWLSNVYIATQRIKNLNKINIISNVIAFSCLLLINKLGVFAAILTFFIQPVVFIILIWIESIDLIPKKFIFNIEDVQWILSFGFIPYLSSVFSYTNTQIERWSITYWLGTEEMGRFYLSIAYTAIFGLVPTSLNNLYFPKAMQYFSEKSYIEFYQHIKSYCLILIAYVCLTIVVTLSLSEYVISYFFAKHLENLKYVYIILPGLSAITLVAPIGLIFNASLILKPIFWAYFTSSILLLMSIYIVIYYKSPDLSYFAMLNSLSNIYISVFFVGAFFMFKNILQKDHIV